jgi:hypothetical protein
MIILLFNKIKWLVVVNIMMIKVKLANLFKWKFKNSETKIILVFHLISFDFLNLERIKEINFEWVQVKKHIMILRKPILFAPKLIRELIWDLSNATNQILSSSPLVVFQNVLRGYFSWINWQRRLLKLDKPGSFIFWIFSFQ